MKETWRIKLVAAFATIGATFILFIGLILLWWSANTLIFSHGVIPSEEATPMLLRFLLGILVIALAVFDFIIINALHSLKKWAYTFLFIQYLIVFASNLAATLSGKIGFLIPTLLNLIYVYLIYADRKLFDTSKVDLPNTKQYIRPTS